MCAQTLVNPPFGLPLGADFEICVMNADGSGQTRLTDNFAFDGTPSWSPDGTQIVFHEALGSGQGNELFLMTLRPDGTVATAPQQLTDTPGVNLIAHWGEVRTR
jgi:TolB protein